MSKKNHKKIDDKSLGYIWILLKPKICHWLYRILLLIIPLITGISLRIAGDSQKSILQAFIEITRNQWFVIIIASILIGVLTYLKENSEKNQFTERNLDYYLLFILIGAAIDSGIKFIFHLKNGNLNYQKELLQYTQKIVGLVLKESQIPLGNISTNLMIREEGFLKLIEFDCQTTYRKLIKLPIDFNHPLPGAPEACVKNRITYVHNTQALDVKKFFDDQVDYKSFFSIPITDLNQNVWAVINIDSTFKDQFKNIKYIRDTIYKVITPIISLIKLEHIFTEYIHMQNDNLDGRGK